MVLAFEIFNIICIKLEICKFLRIYQFIKGTTRIWHLKVRESENFRFFWIKDKEGDLWNSDTKILLASFYSVLDVSYVVYC